MYEMASGKKSIKKKSESIDFVSLTLNFLLNLNNFYYLQMMIDTYRARKRTKYYETLKILPVLLK